jgi:hypothetical protein
MSDRLCGPVVRVLSYCPEVWLDSRRYQIFWEVVGLDGVHSAAWVQLKSYLKEIAAAPA